MNIEQILAELRAQLEVIDNPETDAEGIAQASERVAQLNAELETARAQADEERTSREAAAEAARAAIDSAEARTVENIPFGGTETMHENQYGPKAARRAFMKTLAQRAGINLVGGNELTVEERTAYTHTTANTGSVVPKEYAQEILALISGSTVLFADIHKDSFEKIYEVAIHTAIAAGDAAQTNEGAAPANDENGTFDAITLTGVEIKKTFKMSRKMAVQSLDTFDAYITNEIVSRLSNAADAYVYAKLTATQANGGIANANRTTPAALDKAAITAAIGSVNNYGVPAPQGIVVYANNKTIWNQIAMVEDQRKRSYFVDEKTEDPTVQGRIFGKLVKCDDNIADNVILIGYPDLVRGNVFNGPDVYPYVEGGTQLHCFDGYLLFDCALAANTAFSMITVTPAASGSS